MSEPRTKGRGGDSAPLLTLLLGGLALAFWALLPEDAVAALAVTRTGLEEGELWRIFTGHLTHFTGAHLAFDLLAFLVLGIACERRDRERTGWTLFGAAALVSIGVLAFDGGIDAYRGLSGIDTALFTLLLALHWRRIGATSLPRPLVAVAALGLAGKLALEAWGGPIFVSASDLFVPVPVAHWLGATAGLVGGLYVAQPLPVESKRAGPPASVCAYRCAPGTDIVQTKVSVVQNRAEHERDSSALARVRP